MTSEKFLVFLISSASSAIGFLLLSVFFHKFFILGNIQLSGAMTVVLLSLILNGFILAVNNTVSTFLVKDNLMIQLVACFVIILAFVIFCSLFVQVIGLKLLNIWGGAAIAFVITIIEFFTAKYAFKILSKDF